MKEKQERENEKWGKWFERKSYKEDTLEREITIEQKKTQGIELDTKSRSKGIKTPIFQMKITAMKKKP